MFTKINKKLMAGLLLFVAIAINLVFMLYNIKAYDANQNLKSKGLIESTIEHSSKEKENEQNSNNGNAIKKEDNIKDTEYKLLYGEWEVSRIIGQHQTLPVDMETAKNNIGKRITYLQDKISLNGQEERNDPQYSLAVVPVLDPNRSYIEKMPSLKDIGIKGEYFVYVSVSTPIKKYQGFLGNEFYVKDDKTLVVFFNDVYYELKRISYIEDAEYKQTHV